MPLTTDHHEIQAALTRFGIHQEDPMALDLAEHEECIDIDIKGEWFCYEELPPGYEPDPLVCVRYILATR